MDFLALLLIEKEAERFRILHLNRDTMTDIPMVDAAGIVNGSFRGQLALAHAYGSHDGSRCRNTVRAVENLLYGIEIDHYLSLTMDAVAIPVGNRGNKKVMEILFLEEDIDSDM